MGVIERKLLCGAHGETVPCMVCCHLIGSGPPLGFNTAQAPHPDAEWSHVREVWCDRCNGWWARIWPLPTLYNWVTPLPRMVCTYCLDDLRERHANANYRAGWWESVSALPEPD